MQFNLVFDAQAEGAPQSFRDAIQAAANIIAATFTDNITVNIAVGYGESDGTPVTGGGAIGGPDSGDFYGYSQTVGLLAQQVSGDALSGVNALPTGSSIQGQSQVVVWSAEEKALGLASPTDPGIDGSVGFATDIPTSDLIAVALHEITHAMGRVPNGPQPDVFDLFRFADTGGLLFSNADTAPAAYFSLDGGKTDLADYGMNSDPSDFLNGGAGVPNDALDELYDSNTLGFLTRTDILQMEALGFHALVHPSGDFHGVGLGNILWRNDNGDLYLWGPVVGAGVGQDLGIIPSSWQVQQIADVNGDGKADLVWRDTSGDVFISNSVAGPATTVSFTSQYLGAMPTSWHIQASGDFSGAGPDSIVWRNDSGVLDLWNPTTTAGAVSFTSQDFGVIPTAWQIQGVGDVNGDGKADILWRNTSSGDVYLYDSVPGAGSISFTGQDFGGMPAVWQVQAVADFNGDGKADILWRNTSTGDLYLYNSTSGPSFIVSFTGEDLGVMPLSWHIREVDDFNGDGKADILWQNDAGHVFLWDSVAGAGSVNFTGQDFGTMPSSWHVQSDWHGT